MSFLIRLTPFNKIITCVFIHKIFSQQVRDESKNAEFTIDKMLRIAKVAPNL
uniref:Uncharacterized protein n=1 Tax=uncultured alpha proteobacterium HF0070_05I22 TaxID=710803 RepID=E0XX88_9PROT|nr:hypothetical protein [uncultured alpha proteobacterium HF0070_05I22]